MFTSTFEVPDTIPDNFDTGEEFVAHIVEKKRLTAAYILGLPIRAICGTIFIPTRDPEKYPTCEACFQTLSHLNK